MTKEALKRIVNSVNKIRSAYAPKGPVGLPEMSVNTNNREGVYDNDKLADPMIQNQVTGSGNGPIIGGKGRAATY